MSFQSAQLWRSSVQLHIGPLHSCGKIRGKAVVQQSPSRRARRRPSLKMHNVAVCEQQRVNAEQPKPTAAHHTVVATRLPDNASSSALGQSQSTWSMARSGCEPQRRSSQNRFTFQPLSRVLFDKESCNIVRTRRIYPLC